MRYCFFKAGIIDDDGHRKIAGTFQDLTPLIKTQTALEKAKELAENMNRDKSLFLAQASHDLRQPMQALGMFISALAEEKLTDYQKMLLDKIEASADNLKSLLDNLLDLSKLEANTGIGRFFRIQHRAAAKKNCRRISGNLPAEKNLFPLFFTQCRCLQRPADFGTPYPKPVEQCSQIYQKQNHSWLQMA